MKTLVEALKEADGRWIRIKYKEENEWWIPPNVARWETEQLAEEDATPLILISVTSNKILSLSYRVANNPESMANILFFGIECDNKISFHENMEVRPVLKIS